MSFSTFLNFTWLVSARMLTGDEFQAVGPACENARSPNLVRSRGVAYTRYYL